jgi:hypothetical protein
MNGKARDYGRTKGGLSYRQVLKRRPLYTKSQSYHKLTWLFLPQGDDTRPSSFSCLEPTYLCVSDRHPSVDSGQAWDAVPSREGISLPKPLHQHSQLCGVCDKDGKESVCDIGWPPTPEDSSCTTSGGYVCSSPRRPPRFWSRSSHSFTTATLAGLRTIRPLKFIHNAASGLVFNPHSTDTLHLPSAPCVGYGWPSKL